MANYSNDDINYHGESNGVHKWETKSGQPYYWHPDWLHVAEDETGLHPKEDLNVSSSEEATKEHAASAILKHLNDWAKSKFENNPDIETQAVESEHQLKGHDD